MTAPEQEIDLQTLWRGVRRRLPWVLLTSALVAGGVYLVSSGQPNVYQTTSSLMSARPAEGVVGQTLVTAPQLPEGALQEALTGPVVLGQVIRVVSRDERLPPAEREAIARQLTQELQTRRVGTINMVSRLDFNGNGIYTLTARAASPQAAAILADTTAQALLSWDTGRALESVQRAENTLRAQLTEIDRQLASDALDDLERDTLVTTRSATQRNLAQTGILAEAATGSLVLLSPAVQPLGPVAPRPLRNAALAGLLTLLAGLGLTALLTVSDRRVRGEDDLLALGVPVLGSIPRIKRREVLMNGIVRAAHQTGLYEAVGFLRINLLSLGLAADGRPVRLLLSSTTPGEGKSSMTATLADAVAASGKRVLLIDADLRRGLQQQMWQKGGLQLTPVQLVGQGGGTTLQEGLRDPENVQVLAVNEHLHLMPAGPGLHDTMNLMNRPDLGAVLDRWTANYDVVLIDSSPLLALADSLIMGKHSDGMLLVVEAGRTPVQAVRQALRRAENAGVTVLGTVLNKVNMEEQENYNYSYSYAPRRSEA